jgi:hypothetical protein
MNHWGFQPIDLRKKDFICINCKELHNVKKNKLLVERQSPETKPGLSTRLDSALVEK